MAKNTYNFFGVMKPHYGISLHDGDIESFWASSHALLFEKGGELFFFEQASRFNKACAKPANLRVADGVATTDGQYLFVRPLRSDESSAITLDEYYPDDVWRWLAAVKPVDDYGAFPDIPRLEMVKVWLADSPALHLLGNVTSLTPRRDIWTSYGMPNGRMAVGPKELVLDELEGLWRNTSGQMPDMYRCGIIRTLAHAGRDMPREVRTAGWLSHVRYLRELGDPHPIDTQRWTKEYGLPDIPPALWGE